MKAIYLFPRKTHVSIHTPNFPDNFRVKLSHITLAPPAIKQDYVPLIHTTMYVRKLEVRVALTAVQAMAFTLDL